MTNDSEIIVAGINDLAVEIKNKGIPVATRCQETGYVVI